MLMQVGAPRRTRQRWQRTTPMHGHDMNTLTVLVDQGKIRRGARPATPGPAKAASLHLIVARSRSQTPSLGLVLVTRSHCPSMKSLWGDAMPQVMARLETPIQPSLAPGPMDSWRESGPT